MGVDPLSLCALSGLSGGAPISEFVTTRPGETVVGIVAADAAGAGLALGTAQGVVKRVSPDYPQNALAQKLTGSVTLEYTVDTRGEPRDIHVVEATPPGVFDQAAISAVKRWHYAPMVVDGSATEVPGVRARVRFELPK